MRIHIVSIPNKVMSHGVGYMFQPVEYTSQGLKRRFSAEVILFFCNNPALLSNNPAFSRKKAGLTKSSVNSLIHLR